jgi:copper chaperone CopZ
MGDAAAQPPPPPPPGGKVQKSYFDVLGICCPSEVPLVERLLDPLPGVRKVTVIVPSRTVIVLHDADATSPAQIGKRTPRPTASSLSSSPALRFLPCCGAAGAQFLAGCFYLEKETEQKKKSSQWGINFLHCRAARGAVGSATNKQLI